MRCNWINSTEGQPFCWVPSCPLPIPASCSHHRNCSSSHPGLQALGERVTGTSCGLRDPGCWWSGPLLPFVWQPLEQIKLGRVAGVCTWIALFKTCVEGRITFVLGHKQAGILLSLLLQRELLIWFFFFNSENLVWRETIISTEVMTVPFLLLRAHLVVLKDMNWLLKFHFWASKVDWFEIIKESSKFLWLEPKAFHVLWKSPTSWDLKAVRAMKTILL